MLINGMDFLNSFRGCQVVDFRMTKRFKGQLEGKNGYIYGVLAVEGILCLVITAVFLKWIVVGPVTLKTIMIDREFIVIMVCISILVALYVYRQKNMLLVVEYTLRIDDTCSEEDKDKIKQEFYLKRATYLDKRKNADGLFVAYPKAKGGVV